MKSIVYRSDIDFIESLSEWLFPQDNELELPILAPRTPAPSYWEPHFKKVSFAHQNLLQSTFEASGFVAFLMTSVYMNSMDWLVNLNAERLREALTFHYSEDVADDDDTLYENISVSLDGYYKTTPSDYLIFRECVYRPDAICDALSKAFSEAYTIFMQDMVKPHQARLDQMLKEMNAAFSSDPETYLKKITLTGYEHFRSHLDDLDIFMMGFSDNCFGASFDPDFIVISPAIAAIIDSSKPNERAMDFIKLISDPKRYEMMKLLSERPHYGAELARALDLTTATVSHHISKMTVMKLIEAEKGEKNRVYFKLNRTRFEDYLTYIKRDILG